MKCERCGKEHTSNKGKQVPQFKVGQRVRFMTKFGDANGHSIQQEEFGRVVKLHCSCRAGVAEIAPDRGGRKIARRLQHVFTA